MKTRTSELDNAMDRLDDIEAQQAEALLRQTQARLARAQRLGRLGYWEWDIQNQTLLWSDEVYRIFGVGRDFELLYENIEGLLHPEDRETNTRNVQALLTTAAEVEIEFRIIRPQGEIRYIVQTAQIERDEAGQPLTAFGIMQDVTERRRTEQALRRSQSELAVVYEHAPVMMCLLGPHREVLYANRAFTAFTSVSEAELVQGRACGVFGCINADEHPDGCGFGASCQDCQLRLAIEDTLATGQGHRDVEYRATLERAGVRRDVVLLAATASIESGESLRVLLCLEDITERKLAEDTLRESEARYRDMAESLRRSVARATHTQNVLLALSRAVQAVQRARSQDAIYQTIGEEIDKLGYYTLVFTLSDDNAELAIVYVSQMLEQLQAAKRLNGVPSLHQRFEVPPGSFCAQTIAASKTVFMEHGIEHIGAAPAGTALALILHLSTVLGADKIISAPLKIDGRIQGLLVVMGDTLTEADVPAIDVFANQVSIALDTARALADVRAAHERMRWLTQQIVSAQEEERKRIAQELHDALGQTLTAISFDLAAIDAALSPEQQAAVAESLAEAQALTDYLDERVGAMALDLRPAMLDDLGLAATLRWYVNTYRKRHTIDVMLDTCGLETRLSPEVETALYRVIQEALTNVSKHADATDIRIAVSRAGHNVTVSIEDNGDGFAAEEVAGREDAARGLGLLGMQERIAALGGVFVIDTEPGQGTRLHIEIPLQD